jgi:aromatic ring-cleaving dioxygenase
MSAWMFRCPHGHASLITPHTKDYYHCEPCGATWPGDPVNLKRESLPDESEMPTPIGERDDEQ